MLFFILGALLLAAALIQNFIYVARLLF